MVSCVFCSIINQEEPALKVYEDDHTVAIIPRKPEAWGHCLVIPKQHCEDLFSIPDDALASLSKAVKNVARLCKDKLRAEGVNILHASGKTAGQSVPHFHFHVIPRYEGDGVDAWMRRPKDFTDRREELFRVLSG